MVHLPPVSLPYHARAPVLAPRGIDQTQDRVQFASSGECRREDARCSAEAVPPLFFQSRLSWLARVQERSSESCQCQWGEGRFLFSVQTTLPEASQEE